jgi:hypothetical protein
LVLLRRPGWRSNAGPSLHLSRSYLRSRLISAGATGPDLNEARACLLRGRRLTRCHALADGNEVKPQATLRAAKADRAEFLGMRINPIALDTQLGSESCRVNVAGSKARLDFLQ